MIHSVTPKADLPAKASHRSDATEETRLHATEERSDSEKTGADQAVRVSLQEAVGKIRQILQNTDSHLEIEIDPDLQRVVVKIVNGDSHEVIRQIPAKELLNLAKSLPDLKGLLLREQA